MKHLMTLVMAFAGAAAASPAVFAGTEASSGGPAVWHALAVEDDPFEEVFDTLWPSRERFILLIRPLDRRVPVLKIDDRVEELGAVSGIGPGAVDEARQALERSQEAIGRIIELTRTNRFTSEPWPMLNPLEPAFELKVGDPWFKPRYNIREAARILRADAARCWGEGDTRGCAERLAAMVRLGGRVEVKDILMGGTGWSVLSMAAKSIRQCLEQAEGSFSAADRRVLLEELRKLDSEDPGGFREGWLAEANWKIDWMRRKLVGEDAGRKWDEILLANEPDEEVDELVREGPARGNTDRVRETWSSHLRRYPDRPARALSGEEIQELVSAAERQMQEIAEGWAEGKPAAEEIFGIVDEDRAQIIRVVLGEALSLRRLTSELRGEIAGCIEALERADAADPR